MPSQLCECKQEILNGIRGRAHLRVQAQHAERRPLKLTKVHLHANRATHVSWELAWC